MVQPDLRFLVVCKFAARVSVTMISFLFYSHNNNSDNTAATDSRSMKYPALI